MGEVFTAVPQAMAAFSAAHQVAAGAIAGVGSVDALAMNAAVAAAIGLFGPEYVAAHTWAQANHLDSTLALGEVHAAISAATEASSTAVIAADQV